MVVEESIVIDARVEDVWELFANLACWQEWNTVLEDVSLEAAERWLSEGRSFTWCIRPFMLPIHFEPTVEQAVEGERIVWSGEKFGIRARHEFIFTKTDPGRTEVLSRETFSGITPAVLGRMFPGWKIKDLTVNMLKDLKNAVEHSVQRR